MSRLGILNRLMVLIALLSVSAGAMAQDLPEITLDTEYTVGMFQSPKYTFTAPQSCRIYMYCTTNDFPEIWRDSSFSEPYNVDINPYNNPRWSFAVEEGQTYYIGYGLAFTMEETTFYITTKGLSAVEATSVSPSLDEPLAVGYPISLAFNVPVSIATASLQGGDSPLLELGFNLNESFASFEIKDILYKWMMAGELKENDDVTLTLTGVSSVGEEAIMGGDDGTMVFTWKSAPVPVSLVKAYIPAEMKSKWPSGDPDGIAVFEFSGDLADGVLAYITNGDLSKGGSYEELPVTVDGSKIYVDFTGVARVPAMEDTYVLTIANVRDAAGYPAYAPGQGKIGSYNYTIVYDDEPYIEPASFNFTPANGTDIKEATEIFIHVTNVTDAFKYTGAAFFYTQQSVQKSISIDKAAIEEDNLGTEVNLFIDIPAALADADAGSNVIFTLLYEDTTVASATYVYGEAVEPELFGIALISPADGSTLEKIGADEYIELSITGIPADADVEVEGHISDDATGEDIKWCFFYPADGDSYNYSCMMYDDVDLYEGHTYTLKVVANAYTYDEQGFRNAPTELGSASFVYYGAGKEFVYSDVKLIGIDPDPTTTDITSVDQNVVTVRFSGPVSELRAVEPIGMGAGAFDYKTAKANDEGTEWTFTIPQSTISAATGTIVVNMYATDAEGHPVWMSALYDELTWRGVPNAMQAKEETHFYLMYKCTVGSPDIVVTPENGSVVDCIDKFVLSYPTGIDFSWSTYSDVVLSKDGEVVQTWPSTYFDSFENEAMCEFSGDVIVAWTLMLDEPQTEPGVYTLVIPNCYFNLGSEFFQANSKQQTVTVTIDKLQGISAVEIDGAGSTPVYNISGQMVGSDYKGIVIKDGKKVYNR